MTQPARERGPAYHLAAVQAVEALTELMLANRELNTVSERRGVGATRQQARAAQYLSRSDSMTVNELAEVLVLSPSRVSRLADDMVAGGLLERLDDPGDRRVVRLRLRPEIRRRCQLFDAERTAAIERAMDGLSAGEAEMLARVLGRIAGEYEALVQAVEAGTKPLPEL